MHKTNKNAEVVSVLLSTCPFCVKPLTGYECGF